ncbi:MAG: PHP domain-containing protein, partial [Dehalococcoidia bacterium]
ENILRHIHSLRTKDQRTPLGQALPIVERIIADLRERCPTLKKATPAGSVRRWQETVGDIDIMGTAQDPVQVIDALVDLPYVREVLVHGPKKASVVVDPGLQVDLRIVEDDSFGAMVQYFTGNQQHNVRLRDYANRMGLSLNEYGITNLKTGQMEKFADEEGFYDRLGLQMPPPEIRQGLWELDLAQKHALPRLVEQSDIRGDLHMHSDWSDGREPIEAMMEAASRFGHQYVALTDHSSGRGIANGLSDERLQSQIKILRTLEGFPVKILCGSEVDIRADGSLDYPDELLAELDVVVASVHSAMGQPVEKMTERIIKSMHNPHVTVIGHPTARLLGSRDPVEVDMEALLQAALETGTAMEINSSPERLDLKDTHVLRARELGVPLVISTDSHSSGYMDKLRFGVAVARRGWCEPKHIVNTMPLEEFMAFIKAPKSERIHIFAGRVD